VIVAVKDRRELMLRCLDALRDQDFTNYEICVVDNGSSDGTFEACCEYAEKSELPIRVERTDGLIGRVRNFGVRMARGEIVAFTDSDCAPAPGWLAAGMEPFADPRVGLVTGTTLPEHGPPFEPWYATIEITEQTWRFETCNAFFRREALLAVGGFDESRTMWEDTMAGWAMIESGWVPVFKADALVQHEVTYPGYVWHLRQAQRYAMVAIAIRRFPQLRQKLLWRRYFLRPTDARFVAALVGLAFAPINRKALALAIPYAHERWPGRPGRSLRGVIDLIGLDAAIVAGLARASIEARRLVL
jgi:cellulose synthase/poly-beta-1,6-N-acetylglucosamine synthase-like glycosyltransferase